MLYTNPSVARYMLRRIVELVANPSKAAEVEKEVAKQIQTAKVTASCKALVMYVSLEFASDDVSSGAKMDIITARPMPRQGMVLSQSLYQGWSPL